MQAQTSFSCVLPASAWVYQVVLQSDTLFLRMREPSIYTAPDQCFDSRSKCTLASSDVRITVYIGVLTLHESAVESEQRTTIEAWQMSERQWMWWDWI